MTQALDYPAPFGVSHTAEGGDGVARFAQKTRAGIRAGNTKFRVSGRKEATYFAALSRSSIESLSGLTSAKIQVER
jgi:hypothetical protein